MRRSWYPWSEMELLRREIDRLFDGAAPAGRPSFPSAFLPGRSARSYPLMNVYENPDGLEVEALAPGLDPESLDVTVQGNVLTVSGEKTPIEGVEVQRFHRTERSAGRFTRTFEIGIPIDERKVKASYEDGMLRLELPKSAEARPKQIKVNVRE